LGGGVLDSTLSVKLGKFGALATLTVNGLGATLNGSFDSFANATMTANGDITMGAGATFNNDLGSTFNIESDHGFAENGMAGLLTNHGTFEKTAGTGGSTIAVPFANAGGTLLAQLGTLAFTNTLFEQTAGTTELNGGAISSTFSFDMQAGYLEGVGTFTFGATHGVDQTGGTVLPGLGNPTGGAKGTLTVAGDYTEGGSATLVINTDPTGVSQLNVQGNVDVNGALVVNKDPEFNPPLGNTYAFLTWNSITQADNFSSITINNNYGYGHRLILATNRSLPNKQYDLVVVQGK